MKYAMVESTEQTVYTILYTTTKQGVLHETSDSVNTLDMTCLQIN